MGTFTNKTKQMAALVASAAAVIGGAAPVSGAAAAPGISAGPNLDARVVALGQVAGFWATDCPIVIDNESGWTQADDAEASALRREGFVVGARELLRSSSGESGVSSALRFRSASGAAADLERRELEAGKQGYATNFAVPGAPSVRAYTVRRSRTTIVHVAFTRGADEYAITVETTTSTRIAALETALAAVVGGEARHG